MIIDSILNFIFNAIYAVLDFLPSFPSLNLSNHDGFIDLISHCAYFLPLGSIALCVASIVVVNGVMNNVWLFNWIIKRIRGG